MIYYVCPAQNIFQWMGVLLVFGGIGANMAGKYINSHSAKIHKATTINTSNSSGIAATKRE